MRALLIDDDVALCDLLVAYMKSHGIQLDLAHDGTSGLEMSRLSSYEIVLLDVMLPVLDGFAVLRQLRRHSRAPVIMLTARGEEPDKILGLEQGADDYVTKPFSTGELVARMRALRRRAEPDQRQLGAGEITLELDSSCLSFGSVRLLLTEIETRLMAVLIDHIGQPVSRELLSRVVLHRDSAPTDRSLDTHVSNLRKKLFGSLGERVTLGAIRNVGYQLNFFP